MSPFISCALPQDSILGPLFKADITSLKNMMYVSVDMFQFN